MSVTQVAMVGIAGIILILQLKDSKSEYGVYLTIAVSLLIFFGMSGRLAAIKETIQTISSAVNVDDIYIQILMKMLGVVYIAEFASGICKDAGYQTISSQIEIFAKLTLLVLSLPVLEALLLVIQRFLS